MCLCVRDYVLIGYDGRDDSLLLYKSFVEHSKSKGRQSLHADAQPPIQMGGMRCTESTPAYWQLDIA